MKKLLSILLVLTMLLSFAACDGGEEFVEEENTENVLDATETAAENEGNDVVQGDDSATWSVYWYLCGSDLETNGGFATTDLDEMLQVELPENVNVVIQTGGANVWQNDIVNPAKLQRWLYNSEGLQLLEEIETASMGDAQTLYEFLAFANANFPA
ncbi:MAG: hypothetical protein IKU61_06040, partial [Clostridia bacterium]|nr:hypothetical protein [Clostridia bacterium]